MVAVAAFPRLIHHPNHGHLIDTWNHSQEDSKGGVGSVRIAPFQRSAEKKLELGAVRNIFIHDFLSEDFPTKFSKRWHKQRLDVFKIEMMPNTFTADRDPLVSSAAVCVLFRHRGRAAELSFWIPFSALVSHYLVYSFLYFEGSWTLIHKFTLSSPFVDFWAVRSDRSGEALLSRVVSPSSQQLTGACAESLLVFRSGYSHKWFVV